jgi:CheY-like chemotaxis protein
MDVQMPLMDGLDATRRIRERERDEARTRTPIVALTADAMGHQVSLYAAIGMDGHLAKPIEVEALLAQVSRFLTTSEPAEPRLGAVRRV